MSEKMKDLKVENFRFDIRKLINGLLFLWIVIFVKAFIVNKLTNITWQFIIPSKLSPAS